MTTQKSWATNNNDDSEMLKVAKKYLNNLKSNTLLKIIALHKTLTLTMTKIIAPLSKDVQKNSMLPTDIYKDKKPLLNSI